MTPAQPPKRPLLEVRGVSVRYGTGSSALRSLSLQVEERAVVGVLGGNGAGKTTLLHAISGTLEMRGAAIEAGSIVLAGEPISGCDAARIVARGLVHVPESRRIFTGLTVEENLRAGALRSSRREVAAARARVEALFPVLRARRRLPAGLLSGGEQQMLALGRALMARPKVLMLDEPSLGLAPAVIGTIAAAILEIRRAGTAILLAEQNAAVAMRVVDRAYVIAEGQVQLAGTPSELERSQVVRDLYLGGGTPPWGPRSPRTTVSTAAAKSRP